MQCLSNQQHIEILGRLVTLAASRGQSNRIHSAGMEYHSLMVCFLLHGLSAAKSLQHLYSAFTERQFPTTVGYGIVRPLFEIDVTSHYITVDPTTRAHQYVSFGVVLKKRQMDACRKHCDSNKHDWNAGMNRIWREEFEPVEKKIESEYKSVRSYFVKPGKTTGNVRSWSGKSLREMATEVDHVEAYDVFYADLSSFAHADVRLADRFLKNVDADSVCWSDESRWQDVGAVFRYADIFLSCFLKLFGKEFCFWSSDDVDVCWRL